jgi:predicted DNA-binding transcriptional regulator YafY
MQNAVLRRREILEWLNDERYATRADLAKKFGVSMRTIQRDIEALSCTYPIYTSQGNGGGIYMQKGYYAFHNFLSDEQVAFLERILPGLQPEQQACIKRVIKSFAKPADYGTWP